MTNQKRSDVPDQGWAWVILIGVAVIGICVYPLNQCLGLILKDRFNKLGINATEISLIIHLNSTIMCSLGLISGPMMRRLSWRCVAYLGSFIIVAGIVFTAFAESLPTIIVAYCFFIGIGQGIIHPATSLSLNTYFREKRKIAMGISVTLTGLGPIIMLQFIVKLLDYYGTTGTLLIVAGICAHSIIGASLLRPFRKDDRPRTLSYRNYHQERHPSLAMTTIPKMTVAVHNGAVNHNNTEEPIKSISQLDSSKEDAATGELNQFLKRDEPRGETLKKKKSGNSKRAENLDLDLLRDSRYVIAVLGMSVSFVSELNFNLMIPFVLAELATLNKEMIAEVMSIQAIADIVARLCIPLLAHKVGWTSRSMYLISLIGSSLARTMLVAWKDRYVVISAVSVLIGLAKGTKAVFQSLVIPDCVPLERLPAASGLLMVANGILSIALGPLIGLVHDQTESYVKSLHFTSALSLACVALWLAESFSRSRRNPPRRPQNSIDEEVIFPVQRNLNP